MNKHIKNCIAATSVLAGLGVAMLPLTSFAEPNTSTYTGNVSVNVPTTLTLTLAVDDAVKPDASNPNRESTMEFTLSPKILATGKFTAAVHTNRTYNLTVNGDSGNNKLKLDGTSDVYYIPSRECGSDGNSTSLGDKIGKSCWGIKRLNVKAKNAGTGLFDTELLSSTPASTDPYAVIPSSIDTDNLSTAQHGWSKDTSVSSTDQEVTFELGIYADSSLANGTYTGSIVVTASTN